MGHGWVDGVNDPPAPLSHPCRGVFDTMYAAGGRWDAVGGHGHDANNF